VCTTDISNIGTDTTFQVYFRVLPLEDRREYRDVQLRYLWNLHERCKIAVEDNTCIAMAECNGLTPAAVWNAIAPAMEIKEPLANQEGHGSHRDQDHS
jgi:hypothetical protein